MLKTLARQERAEQLIRRARVQSWPAVVMGLVSGIAIFAGGIWAGVLGLQNQPIFPAGITFVAGCGLHVIGWMFDVSVRQCAAAELLATQHAKIVALEASVVQFQQNA